MANLREIIPQSNKTKINIQYNLIRMACLFNMLSTIQSEMGHVIHTKSIHVIPKNQNKTIRIKSIYNITI